MYFSKRRPAVFTEVGLLHSQFFPHTEGPLGIMFSFLTHAHKTSKVCESHVAKIGGTFCCRIAIFFSNTIASLMELAVGSRSNFVVGLF